MFPSQALSCTGSTGIISAPALGGSTPMNYADKDRMEIGKWKLENRNWKLGSDSCQCSFKTPFS